MRIRTTFECTLLIGMAGALVAVTGCAQSAVKYDPRPAPAWIKSVPASLEEHALVAIGQAPATINPARDLDLATRNAKSQIAQLFESRVVSRASDWSLVMKGAKGKVQRDLFQTSIDVGSKVVVEDVRLAAHYREENTRTQYVRILVDRKAWSNRLQARVNDGFSELKKRLDSATRLQQSHKPLRALKELSLASAVGRNIEPDVLILDLLLSNSPGRNNLKSIKTNIDQLGRTIRNEHRFVLHVQCTDTAATSSVKANIEEFLGKWGFAVAHRTGEAGLIQVQINLEQHPVVIEKVAGRIEHVHAGTGSLKLHEPDGSVLSELGVTFRSDRFCQRHTDKSKASQMALQLAADTLGAKFRSAVRNFYCESGPCFQAD